MLNRSAVILTAKQPFIDWVQALPDPMKLRPRAKDLNQDRTVYLLPEWDTEAQQEGLLEDFFHILFDAQLEDWWRHEKDWPKKRTVKMFKAWFHVEFCSVVEDLVAEPLEDDDGP